MGPAKKYILEQRSKLPQCFFDTELLRSRIQVAEPREEMYSTYRLWLIFIDMPVEECVDLFYDLMHDEDLAYD